MIAFLSQRRANPPPYGINADRVGRGIRPPVWGIAP